MAYGPCSQEFGTFGDRFVELGDWRLAAIDETHFSVSHRHGYTAQIWRNDGLVFDGPRTDYNAWSRPIGFPHGITFGPSFIQIGSWRLGQVDGTHFSIAHRDSTAQIFRSDGTLHNGPRQDYSTWSRSTGPARGITFGDRLLVIGSFRLGDVDGTHFSVGHVDGQTIQIYRSDGHLFPGPRTDYNVLARYPQWHCESIQEAFGTCAGITAGHNFLQLGDWRLAAVDDAHFSVSHKNGNTARIYRSDGHLFPGPRRDYGSWQLEAKSAEAGAVKFGDRFIELGLFRMGEVDSTHFSISHRDGWTAQIFRADGSLHAGPRSDYHVWGRPVGDPFGVSFGDRFLQIGNFRVGDVDGVHFSVSHLNGNTMQIFRDDGTLHPGPRQDYTTFGRALAECRVVP